MDEIQKYRLKTNVDSRAKAGCLASSHMRKSGLLSCIVIMIGNQRRTTATMIQPQPVFLIISGDIFIISMRTFTLTISAARLRDDEYRPVCGWQCFFQIY